MKTKVEELLLQMLLVSKFQTPPSNLLSTLCLSLFTTHARQPTHFPQQDNALLVSLQCDSARPTDTMNLSTGVDPTGLQSKTSDMSYHGTVLSPAPRRPAAVRCATVDRSITIALPPLTLHSIADLPTHRTLSKVYGPYLSLRLKSGQLFTRPSSPPRASRTYSRKTP